MRNLRQKLAKRGVRLKDMFQLTTEEWNALRSQSVTSKVLPARMRSQSVTSELAKNDGNTRTP
jgi:hypothetical protein